jgi:transposase, IS30 family
LLMLFSNRMISEVVQPFWAAVQRGEFITEAAESVGTYREMGGRWIAAAGGAFAGDGLARAAAQR